MSAQDQQRALAGYMALTQFIGDAVSQATPEQRARIRDETLPLLRDYDVPVSEVTGSVLEIMGLGWTLRSSTRDWISSLIKSGKP